MAEVKDPNALSRRMQNINDLRLNLESGEQCVRDFFVCIKENANCWPEVFELFSIPIAHSSICLSCNGVNESEIKYSYVDLDVPDEDSFLKASVENFFNTPNIVNSNCELCKSYVQVEVKDQLVSINETQFIIIILRCKYCRGL